MKVGIINFGNILNRGCEALLDSKISILRNLNNNVEISVFSFHPNSLKKERKDIKIYGHYFQPYLYGIRVNIFLWLFRVFIMFPLLKLVYSIIGTNGNKMLINPSLRKLSEMDLIVTSGGDDWSEDYGYITPISCMYLSYISKLMGKKVVLWGESIGPFKNTFLINNLYKYLNKIDVIGVREPISLEYLRNKFNLSNVILTWDTAFILPPSNIDNVKLYIPESEYFCISFSQMISRYVKITNLNKNSYNSYIEIMANWVDYLIGKTEFYAVFIPHVFEQGSDDRIVCKNIFNKVKNKSKVLLIEDKLTASQFKKVISKGKFFIGSRMHPIVAALSSNIPSISISYSLKYEGIIGKMFNMDNYIFNVKNGITIETLVTISDEFLKEYEKYPDKLALINKKAQNEIKDFARRLFL